MPHRKPLKIAVAGASGRLGRLILSEAIRRTDLELVAGLVSHDSVMLGADLGELAETPLQNIETTVSVEDAAAKADVIIDVSVPRATAGIARQIIELKSPPALVCGVTGLGPAERAALDEASQRVAVLYARNFSMGATLMEKLVADAAAVLPADEFDIEILEAHHKRKADSPSGTAIALGEAAAKGRGLDFERHAMFERPRTDANRPVGTIGFAALRGGAVVGEHSAFFLGGHEEIEIRHRANDRFIFARGAIEAALWLRKKKAGLWSMHDVLESRLR
jgi:4-hydroxy-tetrahydrodipicolinate reductase